MAASRIFANTRTVHDSVSPTTAFVAAHVKLEILQPVCPAASASAQLSITRNSRACTPSDTAPPSPPTSAPPYRNANLATRTL